MWEAIKAEPRGKYIALKTILKIKEKTKINWLAKEAVSGRENKRKFNTK